MKKRSRTVRRRCIGDSDSATPFRRWWSQIFYAKKMCFWNILKVGLQKMFASLVFLL